MPELPEVEMVVRHLQPLLTGRQLMRADLRRARLAPELTVRQFAARLRLGEVEEVARRGKHILVHLSTSWTWITHLRMSGRFLYAAAETTPEVAHTHLVIELNGGDRLLFADPRHFAWMTIVRREEWAAHDAIRKLAPEPFEEAFTVDYLETQCRRSRLAVKLLLLDQERVLGLGNIYAAEALHRAGIDPRRSAVSLSRERIVRLHEEIVSVLREAIAVGSTLQTDPREVYGRYGAGAFEENWRVYDREGQPCRTCGSLISRLTQGGRSTYFCPGCQVA
jgi:formamidopyrimidine-DNA glycosylase